MNTAEQYKRVLDQIGDGIYFVDTDRRITYWNRGAERITGFLADEVVGRCCADGILTHVNREGVCLCGELCPLKHTMLDGQNRETDIWLHHKDGHRVPVHVCASPVRDERGLITGSVEVFTDRSSKLAALEQVEELKKLALLDPVTGVGNRRYLETHLQGLFAEFGRFKWPFAVLFCDVDHFKLFNDQHGHELGDRVLRMVARTIAGNLRPFDFVGRYGGEEFVVALINVSPDYLEILAERLRMLVEQTYLDVGGKQHRATISLGGTLVRQGDTVQSLLERADSMMYQSKTSGRNRVTIY